MNHYEYDKNRKRAFKLKFLLGAFPGVLLSFMMVWVIAYYRLSDTGYMYAFGSIVSVALLIYQVFAIGKIFKRIDNKADRIELE